MRNVVDEGAIERHDENEILESMRYMVEFAAT
jgi:hypothetical protein